MIEINCVTPESIGFPELHGGIALGFYVKMNLFDFRIAPAGLRRDGIALEPALQAFVTGWTER